MPIFKRKKRAPRRSPNSDVRLDLRGGYLIGKDFKLSVEEADEAIKALMARIPGLVPESGGSGTPTRTTAAPRPRGRLGAPSAD